jgi:glycosyltransferase involved in cell wall biosynthesis
MVKFSFAPNRYHVSVFHNSWLFLINMPVLGYRVSPNCFAAQVALAGREQSYFFYHEARSGQGRLTKRGRSYALKILHVIRSLDPRGGGPIEFLKSISAEWTNSGHTCDLVTLDAPSDQLVSQSPLTTFALGPLPSPGYVSGQGYGYSPRLAPWMKEHSTFYDVVIVHGLWNYASVGSWRGLRNARVPYFVFTHGMLDPWFNEAFPIKAALKTVFWKALENRVLRDACGVLFTTTEERDLAGTSFRPYFVRPIVVGLGARDVPGEAAVQQLAFKKQMPELDGRRFILFLSRIHPKKGIDLLIRAFALQSEMQPDLDLVVAGPDQVGLQSTLQSLAADIGLGSRIHWPGMLTGDAKFGAFRAAEFFALTSHQENFGIAVAEALALSKPVLITNKVNIWRDIEQDQAGLVVNDDFEGVSNGLSQLCVMSSDERVALSDNARRCFEERYDLRRVAVSMIDLLYDASRPWRAHIEDEASRRLPW